MPGGTPHLPCALFRPGERLMKAILIVVLGVILAGMILGLVFKLIGLAITAAVVIVIAYFVWRALGGGRTRLR